MRLATTTADFKGYASTPADRVRLFAGTGFRYLDYDFTVSFIPALPFLGDDWMAEVEEVGRAAEELGIRFLQAHGPNYNPFDSQADHAAGMLAMNRSHCSMCPCWGSPA